MGPDRAELRPEAGDPTEEPLLPAGCPHCVQASVVGPSRPEVAGTRRGDWYWYATYQSPGGESHLWRHVPCGLEVWLPAGGLAGSRSPRPRACPRCDGGEQEYEDWWS